MRFCARKVAQIPLAQNWQFWTIVTSRRACEREFKLLITPLPIPLERIWPKSYRIVVGPRYMLYDWLTYLLRVLMMMLDECMWCFIDSTSLRWHRRLNLIVVASLLMFNPIGMVTLGGGVTKSTGKTLKYLLDLLNPILVLELDPVSNLGPMSKMMKCCS